MVLTTKKNMHTKNQLYEHWKNNKIITNEKVLDAFMQIPRENFIHTNEPTLAYQDHPLPIGNNQTISQPTTVMLMLELLEVGKNNKILEIGAGSGYNAAILSILGDQVYSIERIPELVKSASNNLQRSNIKNVKVIAGDGKSGYKNEAPYHRIIVTAAAASLPDQLINQLECDGILVIPVGHPYGCNMLKIKKSKDNQISTTKHGLFSFVPLV